MFRGGSHNSIYHEYQIRFRAYILSIKRSAAKPTREFNLVFISDDVAHIWPSSNANAIQLKYVDNKNL